MSLTTELTMRIVAQQVGSNDLGTVTFDLNKNDKTNMATGTASGKADQIFADTRTLSASATEDLDLAASLVDALGTTLTFVKVKAIYIKAASGNTNNVEVTPAAANGFLGAFNAAADQVDIAPGGMFLVTAPAAGWSVTAGTGDLITVTNSAGSTAVTYDVVIVGTSA